MCIGPLKFLDITWWPQPLSTPAVLTLSPLLLEYLLQSLIPSACITQVPNSKNSFWCFKISAFLPNTSDDKIKVVLDKIKTTCAEGIFVLQYKACRIRDESAILSICLSVRVCLYVALSERFQTSLQCTYCLCLPYVRCLNISFNRFPTHCLLKCCLPLLFFSTHRFSRLLFKCSLRSLGCSR